MRVLDTVLSLVFQAVFYVYLLLFRVIARVRQNIMVLASPSFRPNSPGYRSILIIGDVLAEGIGDSINNGGLAVRLNRLLGDPHTQTGLRLTWSVVTAGRLHAKSDDWLPVTAGRDAAADTRSLFYRSVVSGPFSGADIVVVLLGAHDEIMGDSGKIVDNIAHIADAVARLGKHVVVGSIPCFDSAGSDMELKVRQQNLALSNALSSMTPDKYKGGSVALGIDLQRALARGQDVTYEEMYLKSLNAFGFRTFARDVCEAIAPVAKKVEWEYFKARLRPNIVSDPTS